MSWLFKSIVSRFWQSWIDLLTAMKTTRGKLFKIEIVWHSFENPRFIHKLHTYPTVHLILYTFTSAKMQLYLTFLMAIGTMVLATTATKLNHYFLPAYGSVKRKAVWGFETTPNPRDDSFPFSGRTQIFYLQTIVANSGYQSIKFKENTKCCFLFSKVVFRLLRGIFA